MKIKGLSVVLLCLFFVSGCGEKDKNKLNINEEMFESASRDVKEYAKWYNDEIDYVEDISFFEEFDTDADASSENEELLVTYMLLLNSIRELYNLASFNEQFDSSGSKTSDDYKEELKEYLLEIRETFGISLE